MIVWLLVVSFYLSGSPARATESAGARGGGTGVLCDANSIAPTAENMPILLEEYELKQEGKKVTLPEERSKILEYLSNESNFHHRHSMNFHETYLNGHFIERFTEVWSRIKDYDSWTEISETQVGETIGSPQITEAYQSLLTHFKIEIPKKLHPVVGDDYFEIKDHCQKVQLSLFNQGILFRVKEFHPSEQTKRMLEIHETLYLMQLAELLHVFPAHVRKFTEALAINKSVKSAFGDFIRFETIGNGSLQFFNDLIRVLESGDESCPLAISSVADIGKLRLAFLMRNPGDSNHVHAEYADAEAISLLGVLAGKVNFENKSDFTSVLLNGQNSGLSLYQFKSSTVKMGSFFISRPVENYFNCSVKHNITVEGLNQYSDVLLQPHCVYRPVEFLFFENQGYQNQKAWNALIAN